MATQQEHPRRKLWQSLSDQGKYTKTYEEFHQQFSSPEKIEALYTALNTDGSYTKSYEDFDSQFFGGVGKPTGLSATGSADTPNVSEDPTQSTESPESATLPQNETSSEPSLPENIAPQISQANQIASEYGQEGQSFDIDVPDGYSLVQGEVDSQGQLLNPYLVNDATGERSNIIPTADTTAITREQALAQNARIAEEERDQGFVSDIYNSLVAGAAEFNSSLASVPEYLLRIGAVPQNLLADAIDNNAGEGTADFLRARYGDVSTGDLNPLRIISDYAKSEQEKSGEYARAVTQYDEGIAESLTSGNFADAGRQVLNSVVQSVPALIGMAVTSGASAAAGAGTIGRAAIGSIPFSAGAYRDIEDNPNMSENTKLVASAMKGFSELAFEETLGTLPIIKSIADKAIGREAVTEVIKGYMGRLLNSNGIPASAFKGAISEGATNLSQNIIKKYSGENPNQDLFEGVADSMIVGSALDAGLGSVNSIADRIVDTASRQEVTEAEAQITSMKADLDGLPGPQAELLQQAIERKAEQINQVIVRDEATAPSFTEAQLAEMDRIANSEREVQQIIDSEDVSEETKVVMQDRLGELEANRDAIINQAKAQGEVDLFVTNFQELNPNINIDLFEDLPDSVVRTFDRVEEGLPTDPVALEESSNFLYNKHKELTEMKSNPDRLYTIEQIEGIQEQLAQDIETLENYRYEQTGERSENTLQPETAVDNVAREETVPDQGREEIVEPEVETNTQQNEEEQSNIQSAEVPLESSEVAPVQEEAGPAEELVVGNPDEATDSVSAPVQELTAPVEEVNTPPIETEAVSNDNVADEQTPVQQEIVAPIDDIDATRMFAESTDDPVAIADEYSRTPAGEADYIEQGIADSLTKVSAASFGRIKGLDSLTAVKKRRFIDSKSTTANSIDVVAQEVSANLGIEVTEQDIVDFIDRYDGIADFEAQNLVSERQRILADRYYELTGNNLTPTRAERAAATVEAARPDSERFANSDLADQGVTLDEVNAQNEFEASSAPRSTEMKGVLERVSNKLKQTGLANSINLATSAEISEATGRPGDRINGYVDSEGNVVINSETAGLDAPIHEVAHVWEQVIEKQNPEMHAKGMELIQTPEGKVYVDYVRDTQPSLEGQDLYKEALAQAIGDRGARIIESQKTSPIKEWIKKAWEYVGSLVGISGLTANQIRNLTLNEYADAVAVDLLSGKPFVRTTNGDILMESTATSTESMDNVDKFMSDFMLRMKKKNGIVFQGSVDGSLSTQDFVDLTTFFRHATDRGQINGIQDARDAAKAMGINSPAEVDMAYKLSKAMAGTEGGTGFKKSEVSPETLKTADFAKMSDTEYREVGKRLVDEGLVNPNELVADIIREPRALQPWEVTALQYHRTQIQTQIAEASELVENGDTAAVEAFEFQGITGYQGIAAKIEVINAQLFDMEIAMLATANQQSAAFRLRSLMADNDYNVVSYLAEMKAKGYVDPEVEAKMKKLGEELNVVRAKLAKKSAEADAMAEALAQGNINVEAALPVKKAPKRIRTKKSTVDAVNVVLDSLDLSSFGLPGMRFQTNNVIRFQVNPNDAVSASLTNAIAQMKQSIAEGNSSVPDAIEQAIAQVNAEVGEGNWDSVKFRSAVTNQLVQQQIPLKVKKPYVNSEGVLVIPGEYIKQLSRDGNDTIDKMVASASAELGGSFSDYDIQNAISGYGRQSARTRTDLDRKVAKAKRVARLMSQIEDLIKKGERVKTARQKHDNDTQINALREEVRQREYDLEMTPEERAQLAEQKYLDQRKKYLQNYIDQIQDRIDNRDFAPANRENKYEDDAETKALRVEANRIKNEFKAEKYRHELQNKSTIDKAKALGYDIVFNSLRGLSAGADLSAIGVQGAVYAAANPARAAKLVWGTKNTTFSEVEYNNYFAELQNRPFYELARKHGLNLQLPNFYQSIQEEQWKGSLPTVVMDAIVGTAGKGVAFIRGKDPDLAAEYAKDKFNVFTLGDRNYAVVLSQIRMDLFTDFITNQINKKGLDTKLDEKEIRRIAETVNTITFSSRSFQPTGKLGKDIMSSVFFSFPKLIATWKILGAWAPLLIGPNRNTQLFYDAYGKTVIRGLGTMFMAAAIPTAIAALQKSLQDDEEEDPYFYNPNFLNAKHSDFFKLKAGDTRISFFQGIDGNVVFATRFITGEYLTTSSKGVRPLNGEGFNHSRASLFWQYVSNKFAPTTSIAVKASLGDRERQEAFGRFQESLSPMWASGIGDQYESSGSLGETSALAVMGMFGLSYNNYGGAEFAKKRGTNNKKAQDIFSKSGLSVYDPAEGGRSYFDGEEIVKVTGKTYSDEYLPAYQKFMTEAVLSSEKQLDRNVNWETKEGYVKKLKAEAYKYAEIKTSGIYAGGNFNKFSQDGTQYRLLQSQYGIKAKYIKEYLDKEAGRDRGIAKREVAQKLRADGLKGTDGYKEVLTELYLYNIANKAANEKMIRDMRRGKIKLAKQAEYYSDMEKEDFSEE